MIKSSNHTYCLVKPSSDEALRPIVIDSPHSGTQYPTGSGIIAPFDALKTTWDAFVDELWQYAPSIGAPLLAAKFPRAYIDPNRAPDDIDPEMLDEPWPATLSPSQACMRGMGLIRRNALPNVPMYAGKLTVAEVSNRLSQYYEPYHDALQGLIDAAHTRFGKVWHINCHSMKSVGNSMNADNGSVRPDIVVSDRNGTSAHSHFTEWVASQFDHLGYRVSINNPYQGAYIVKRYGAPPDGRNSVQIEVKRSLYMDEKLCVPHSGFERLQKDIEVFLVALGEYVVTKLVEDRELTQK